MNKSKTPTSEKIMIPLRLPPDIYKRMVEEVRQIKDVKRGYSVNEFLTELLEKHLEEKQHGKKGN